MDERLRGCCISPKALVRRADEAQYLGDVPLSSRATAMRPDQRDICKAQQEIKAFGSPRSHVFGYGRLADIDAKLQQFAVNPRSTPERVGKADCPDQLPDVRRQLRTATKRFRLASPVRRKPLWCHRITVSGLTIASALSAFGAMLYSPANISRSKLLSTGLFGDLRRRIFS